MSGSRGHRWLALLPPLAFLVGVPFANGVHVYVLGLPFLLFWIVACILFTSTVLGVIAVLDHRRDVEPETKHAPRAPVDSEER